MSPKSSSCGKFSRQDVVWEEQTPGSGLYFRVKKWLYREKSRYQQIEVIENETYGRVLLLDGLVQTTTADEFFYHEMLVHPALHLHPAPEKVLLIGGGDGGALREVLKHPVKKAVMVEIDEQVVAVAKEYFPWLKPALGDQRAELIIADGNNYVASTKERFDVILVDSSEPVGPSAVLHQKEFYWKMKNILRPRGIIAAQAGSAFFHGQVIRQQRVFLEEMFRYANFYLGPVPTYPGGLWCYVFLSDRINPLRPPARPILPGLKYYNHAVHRSSFALSSFL